MTPSEDERVFRIYQHHALLMELAAIRGLLHATVLHWIAPEAADKLMAVTSDWVTDASKRTAEYLEAFENFKKGMAEDGRAAQILRLVPDEEPGSDH